MVRADRFLFLSSKSLLLAVCGLTLTRIPKTTGFCFAGSLSPKPRIAATSHHFAWSKTPKSSLSLAQRISQCFGSGNTPISCLLWRAAPVIASATSAGILWRVRTWQGSLHTARMCTPGTLRSEATHGKVTKPHYGRQRSLPRTTMQSGNANDGSMPSLAPSDVNGIFAVDKPRNWTSFDVVNKIRSTLGGKLREENPSLTPKQCRIKVCACRSSPSRPLPPALLASSSHTSMRPGRPWRDPRPRCDGRPGNRAAPAAPRFVAAPDPSQGR